MPLQDLKDCQDRLSQYTAIAGSPTADLILVLAAIDPDHQTQDGQLDDAIIDIYEAVLEMDIEDEYDTTLLPDIINNKPGLSDNQKTCLSDAINHYNDYINGLSAGGPAP
ncbi:MAG: hypothetical protein P1U40_07100 [Coxiellaceae bacterium]|nr:hypothetical protein [Coxiellaceae bacterium]